MLGADSPTLDGSASQPWVAVARRYEIFHDVLAPAIPDWRSRFIEGEETELGPEARRAEEAAKKSSRRRIS